VDPGPVPVLTLVATDPNASEVGPDTGTFTITRTGSLAEAVFVGYSVSGSANAADYGNLTNSVTIPAGQATATVVVTPINDGSAEGPETVVLTLLDRVSYLLGAPVSATVTITEAAAPAALAGTWVGTNEHLQTVTFTVAPDGVTLTGFVSAVLMGGLCSGTPQLVQTSSATIVANAFSGSGFSPNGGLTTFSFDGSFSSNTTATGTIHATVVIPGCTSPTVGFTATKQ
jgi:hypothetical protein